VSTEAHNILGVSKDATLDEITAAYEKGMQMLEADMDGAIEVGKADKRYRMEASKVFHEAYVQLRQAKEHAARKLVFLTLTEEDPHKIVDVPANADFDQIETAFKKQLEVLQAGNEKDRDQLQQAKDKLESAHSALKIVSNKSKDAHEILGVPKDAVWKDIEIKYQAGISLLREWKSDLISKAEEKLTLAHDDLKKQVYPLEYNLLEEDLPLKDYQQLAGQIRKHSDESIQEAEKPADWIWDAELTDPFKIFDVPADADRNRLYAAFQARMSDLSAVKYTIFAAKGVTHFEKAKDKLKSAYNAIIMVQRILSNKLTDSNKILDVREDAGWDDIKKKYEAGISVLSQYKGDSFAKAEEKFTSVYKEVKQKFGLEYIIMQRLKLEDYHATPRAFVDYHESFFAELRDLYRHPVDTKMLKKVEEWKKQFKIDQDKMFEEHHQQLFQDEISSEPMGKLSANPKQILGYYVPNMKSGKHYQPKPEGDENEGPQAE
jgi:hypothetical protein